MAKIVRFHTFGSADVLQLDNLPAVEPGEREVRLKVEAIGLNRAEVAFREGKYLEVPTQLPSTLGYEAMLLPTTPKSSLPRKEQQFGCNTLQPIVR